ncbi:MAG TPA: efflux RND transporter periplasmic adaptor subunit [Acidobacteriota bacterium]|jgi:RND family efflux transporter MFP subunit|nr:efflux RND transporter periplasmic adaptor subunit [Acidobacteriota bacterium]
MIHKQVFLRSTMLAAASTLICCCLAGCTAVNSQKKENRPAAAQTPTVLVTRVVAQELDREIRLPGELQAYQDVALYPKVTGFVEWIGVDRGSRVKRGQLLVRMTAPELEAQKNAADAKARAAHAQRLESEAKLRGVREQRLEAEAKLASDDGTYKRLKAAAATPGVVAGNDVEVAQRTVEAARARVGLLAESENAAQAQVRALEEDEKAAKESAQSVRNIEAYLRVTAPFDGIITERNAHTGSFVGPASGPASVLMLRIQEVSRLRLLIPVPETVVSGIVQGRLVGFTVPAYPGQKFSGIVRRIAHSLDAKTRTMAVELDVDNRSGRLAPGMFPEVILALHGQHPSLFVPPSALATTTERTFVIRIRNQVTEWVDVKRGTSVGNLIEVFGNLNEGDLVALRGTDELRAGTKVLVRQASSQKKS